jgi:VWFA-related protein
MGTNAAKLVAIVLCAVVLASHQQGAAQQTRDTSAPSTTIHVDVNVMLLPVVVRDAQGRAVGNLKKEDFEVFDQGKTRAIARLTLEKNPAKPDTSESAAATPGADGGTDAQPKVAPRRFVVFLFDDRHLGVTDLEQTKRAAIRMLDESPASSDWVSVVTTSGTGSGMTRDHAKLQAAIRQLKLQSRPRQDEHQCPYIDHYSADQIINQNSPVAMSLAVGNTVACAHVSGTIAEAMVTATAHQSLQAGDEDARASLEFVKNIVQTMSALRGQRTLVLVSPGFLAVSDAARNLESQILDSAAASSVTINTLDAAGLFSVNLSASLTPSEAPLATLVQHQQEHSDSMKDNQFVMAELADGSGGTFFHNSNDLEGGFKSLTAEPEYRYVLEVSLRDVKPNGTYHSLKVKVDQKGLKLQTRRGYFAPLPAKNKK